MTELPFDFRKLAYALGIQNSFGHSTDAVQLFVGAINSSRLEKLSLGSNPNGNVFVPCLLGYLDSNYLDVLELSLTALQPESAPHIAAYIRSARCRLRSLSINGNMLGFEGTKEILDTLGNNYTLTSLEAHANYSYGDSASSDSEVIRTMGLVKLTWHARNQMLQRCVAQEALALLRHARPILLQPAKGAASSSSASLPEHSATLATHPDLPTEIILHILSFLAPTLSDVQRISIYGYASDSATLPPLLPTLLPRTPHAPTPYFQVDHRTGLSHRFPMILEDERSDWLRMLGCNAFDPGLFSDAPETKPSSPKV